MKLTVIIPTYNEEKVIKKCIQSLLTQNHTSFEIIVVDDGSTDTTLQVLQNVAKSEPRLAVLKQSHKGAGEARNLGAKKAKGSILVFVDADMTFDKEFLKNLVMTIERGESIGTFSKSEYVSNWDNVWARCWNWNLNLPDKQRLPSLYPNEQKVFRAILKKDFEKVGGFSKGGYTDDWSLSEKLRTLAKNAPHAIFYHANPENLGEVFSQARWIGKREYKLGKLGALIALVRANWLFSVIIGTVKSVLHWEWRFILFKLTYDLGLTFGIISYTLFQNGSK